jgi:hypothetical protein
VVSFSRSGRDRPRSRDTLLIQNRLEESPISPDTWQPLRQCNRPRLASHHREKDCGHLEFPLRPESRTREQAWWHAEEWRLPRPRVRRLAGAMAITSSALRITYAFPLARPGAAPKPE